MSDILFISHRMPYPPNKGDKIRSHAIIHALRLMGHNVSLAFLIDDENDVQHLDYLNQTYTDVIYARWHKMPAYMRMVMGGISKTPVTLLCHYSRELADKIKALKHNKKFDAVFYFSGASLNYFDETDTAKKIIDYVDVDSAKWDAYAKKSYFPLSMLYRDEAVKMAKYEIKFAEKSDKSLFVTQNEKDFFINNYAMDISIHSKIMPLNNIVDNDYFTPNNNYDNPYKHIFPNLKHICVMTGVMDYKPNIDAVTYFATHIMPELDKNMPDIGFCIVGRNPTKAVRELAKYKNIFVTGSVDDVRPYIQYASVCVNPLQIARGVQNKVLESMSMSKPTLVSTPAFEGIMAKPNIDLLVCDDLSDWIRNITEILKNPDLAQRLGQSARKTILEHYTIDKMMSDLKEILL